MIIGIPKEIKNQESRIALTPSGVSKLVINNHKVLIEAGAGIGAGFTDEQFLEVGAKILHTAKEIFEQSDMIVKVKEPQAEEYDLIREGQIIFTYFHFASSKKLTEAMIKTKAVCIAYETVELDDGSLPLLLPMSQVAGRMAAQIGTNLLQKNNGGKGILTGGVPGTRAANVLILGGGVVGKEAARVCAGMGANVKIIDINPQKINELSNFLPSNVRPILSTNQNIDPYIMGSDLVIGAVLVPGGKAPVLVKDDVLDYMEYGSVLLDVAVDQGGCIESCKPTTHEKPTFKYKGMLHYGVTNMPGAVPQTSTIALEAYTLPYVLMLASMGWEKACKHNRPLARGLNIVKGNITHEEVKMFYSQSGV